MVKGNASQNSTSQLISTFTGIGRAQPDSEIISNDLVIATANSKGFIINFLKKNNLEPFILSVKGLDELDNVIFSEDIYNSDENIFPANF